MCSIPWHEWATRWQNENSEHSMLWRWWSQRLPNHATSPAAVPSFMGCSEFRMCLTKEEYDDYWRVKPPYSNNYLAQDSLGCIPFPGHDALPLLSEKSHSDSDSDSDTDSLWHHHHHHTFTTDIVAFHSTWLLPSPVLMLRARGNRIDGEGTFFTYSAMRHQSIHSIHGF